MQTDRTHTSSPNRQKITRGTFSSILSANKPKENRRPTPLHNRSTSNVRSRSPNKQEVVRSPLKSRPRSFRNSENKPDSNRTPTKERAELTKLKLELDKQHKIINELMLRNKELNSQNKQFEKKTKQDSQDKENHQKLIQDLSAYLVDLVSEGTQKSSSEVKQAISQKLQQATQLGVDVSECRQKLEQETDSLISITEIEEMCDKVEELHRLNSSKKQPKKQKALAIFNFEGEVEGDLQFKQGDLIEVIQKDSSGWWLGKTGGKVGNFPYNFVQLIV